MIQVEFYGLTRLKVKEKEKLFEADTIEELLAKITIEYDSVSREELENSVIYVNGIDIREGKLFKTKLSGHDLVQIFSPMAGG